MFSRLASSSRALAAAAATAGAAGVGAVALSGGSAGSADFTKSQFGGKALGDDKDEMNFKYFTYENQPDFTDKHRSLMAKTFKENPGLFDKLKNKKTSLGYSLSNAIQAGVETPHLGVGITAGDEESWTLFKDIYYPIIKGWHKYDPESGFHPMDLDFSKLVFPADQAVSIRIHIHIHTPPFPRVRVEFVFAFSRVPRAICRASPRFSPATACARALSLLSTLPCPVPWP
jgi:hypothetical protein